MPCDLLDDWRLVNRPGDRASGESNLGTGFGAQSYVDGPPVVTFQRIFRVGHVGFNLLAGQLLSNRAGLSDSLIGRIAWLDQSFSGSMHSCPIISGNNNATGTPNLRQRLSTYTNRHVHGLNGFC